MNIALTADPFIPVPPVLYGGIERIIALLIEEYIRAGHQVTLFAHKDSQVPCELIAYHSAGNSKKANIANSLLITFAIVSPGFAGAMSIMCSSLFMSIMFPTIFALGVNGLGHNIKLGGALIVMSVAGGAVLPPALGSIAHASGKLSLGYVVVVAAYLLVFTYCLLQRRNVSLQSVERVREIF